MKRSRVLNRPMFNKHNSAYGRGIASNLVTDEQRVRYNAGGRVGMFWGGLGAGAMRAAPWIKKGWSAIKPTWRTKPGVVTGGIDKSKYLKQTHAPASIGSKVKSWVKENPWWAGSAALYGGPAVGETAVDVAKGPVWSTVKQAADLAVPDWLWDQDAWEKKRKKEKVKKEGEPTEKVKWADRLTKVDEPGATGAEEVDTTTLDVADWTPKEKEEKKRDVALAMAERLIGGSRDKWGSTAQMKNLAGALGDVRKITDKEDIRKDQRKYRAYAEAQKDIAKSLEKGKGYASFQAEGMRPGDALYRSAGIDSITIPKGKGAKKEMAKVKSGDVIFDENDSQWKIMTPDGLITVTVNKIVEANRRGDLAELKETVNVQEKEG